MRLKTKRSSIKDNNLRFSKIMLQNDLETLDEVEQNVKNLNRLNRINYKLTKSNIKN